MHPDAIIASRRGEELASELTQTDLSATDDRLATLEAAGLRAGAVAMEKFCS
jgi:hypothetical protein